MLVPYPSIDQEHYQAPDLVTVTLGTLVGAQRVPNVAVTRSGVRRCPPDLG